METFRSHHIGDYLDFFRDFETKKRTVSNTDLLTFTLPVSLIDDENQNKESAIESRIEELGLIPNVKFIKESNKLRINTLVAKDWFAEPIQCIVKHLKSMLFLSELKNVDTILIVGAFGECKLVQDAIITQFPHQHIMVPEDGGLAVLKGAVRFGYTSGIIYSRKSQYTYGIATRLESGLFRDCFESFVSIGTDVGVGSSVTKYFLPIFPNETSISIYTSTRPDPHYVDEETCKEIFCLTVNHPEVQPDEDKRLRVQFYFGQYEIRVKVTVLKTGRTFQCSIDCT